MNKNTKILQMDLRMHENGCVAQKWQKTGKTIYFSVKAAANLIIVGQNNPKTNLLQMKINTDLR